MTREATRCELTVRYVPLPDDAAVAAWKEAMRLLLDLKEGEHGLDDVVRDRDLEPVHRVAAVRRIQGSAGQAAD